MNSDFRELLQAFNAHEVQYLVVGAYAVMHYTQPRYTKDLDVWLDPTPENALKVMRSFNDFGIGLFGGVAMEDFSRPGLLFSVGVAPVRIDFLTSVPPLEFESCWERRRTAKREEDLEIHYLSQLDLVAAKTAAGRPQDLADLDELRRAGLTGDGA